MCVYFEKWKSDCGAILHVIFRKHNREAQPKNGCAFLFAIFFTLSLSPTPVQYQVADES